MTSTQRYLANNRNALLTAALSATSVATIENAVLERPLARGGSARVALSGAYTGHDEAQYEVEITDTTVSTPLISQPIFSGAGTGNISAISFTGTAQTFTVKLADLGEILTAAGTDMEGAAIEARTSGASGNLIHLSIDPTGLVYTATNYSLIKPLTAGSDGIAGPEYDWDTKVMGADGLIPADAHRLVFGEDASIVYRQYKKYQDGKWLYHFEPPLSRDIPQGAPIRFVTGSRTVTVSDGVTPETYTSIVTLYDLLAALQASSALVKVTGVVANDTSPGGMAARDLTTRTDAHCLPPSGEGSDYATSALINYAARAGAATELVEVRCWANSPNTHPSAGVGKELWQVKGSVSGLVESMLQTGEAFTLADKFNFSIKQQLPDGYGIPRGRFSVDDISYVSRDVALLEIEPPICMASMSLGPEAVDQTLTLTYKQRPNTGDCECSSMYAPDLSGRQCLTGTLYNSIGDTDMENAQMGRLSRLGAWHRDAVAGNTSIDTHGELRTAKYDIDLADAARNTFDECLAELYTTGTLAFTPWAATTVTARYAIIQIGDNRLMAQTAGTTGATVPTVPATIGGTVVDGTVTWEYLGAVAEIMWDDALNSLKTDWLLLDTLSSGVFETATVIAPGSTVAVGDVVRFDDSGYFKGLFRILEAGTFGAGTEIQMTTGTTSAAVPGSVVNLVSYASPSTVAPFISAVLLTPYGNLTGAEDIDAPDYKSGGITATVKDFANRYTASMDAIRAAAGIAKKADASTIAGDGCWRDTGASHWWEITSQSGAYAPAFTNEPYFSSRDAGDGYFSTHEFAFQINVKCEASLKVGDTIKLAIGNAGWSATYQVGDTLYLPVIAAQDLYLAGGKDGDNIQTWNIDGSVSGAFPPYLLDLDLPVPYSSSGLAFALAEGGIPFEAGDAFTFAIEGGHYKWRKDAGAWSTPAAIPATAAALSDGLSATFTPGAAPSFATGDIYRFRALQPSALSNVVNPDIDAWKWAGTGATLTANLGGVKTIDCISLAFHTLPSGSGIVLSGGADGVTWDWSETLTWRAGVIAKLFTAKTATYLKLAITTATGGAIGWAWAGQALSTEYSAECQLRRDYSLERGAGLNPSAAFLGATRSGDIEWQQGILKDTDMTGLLAMLDHLKANDDEPMILIPQSTRPEEAWPVRVLLDEIDMPEDGGYQPNTGNDRRYGMKWSVKGVVA